MSLLCYGSGNGRTLDEPAILCWTDQSSSKFISRDFHICPSNINQLFQLLPRNFTKPSSTSGPGRRCSPRIRRRSNAATHKIPPRIRSHLRSLSILNATRLHDPSTRGRRTRLSNPSTPSNTHSKLLLQKHIHVHKLPPHSPEDHTKESSSLSPLSVLQVLKRT